MAAALVGTLLVVCLKLVASVTAQRRAADQRACAMLELGNVMERVTARPWAELTTDALSSETLSPSAERQLPGAELKIEVTTSADEPDAKRITATLCWQDRSGSLLAPMTLTTWRFKTVD